MLDVHLLSGHDPTMWHCRDTPKLTDKHLKEKLQAVPAWQLDDSKTNLTRTFTAKNFTAGAMFLALFG